MESIMYTVDGKEFELQHHGVKGMRWGVRKKKTAATSDVKTNKRGNKEKTTNPNRKREVAIAATAAVGTALAAYGVHKLSTAIKNKAFQKSMNRGLKAAEILAEKGRLNIALEQIKDISSHHGESTASVIKRTVANNSVNGRVDWRNVIKTFT